MRRARVMYGGLTDREHAIVEAHRWQLAHAAANSPKPTEEAWTVIVGLLCLLPSGDVQAAIQKAHAQETSR